MSARFKTLLRGLIFVSTLLSVAIFHEHKWALFSFLGFTALLLLYIDNFRFIKSYLFFAIAGPLSEIICIISGAWTYQQQDIAGIPLWLPFVWGNCGICLIHIAAKFKEIRVE